MFNRKRRWPAAERIETLHLGILFDYDQYKKYQSDIERIIDNDSSFKVMKGDSFHLDWDFTISYYDIIDQLQTISKILDDDNLVYKVNLEADEVDSIFISFIDDIRRCQESIKRRIAE